MVAMICFRDMSIVWLWGLHFPCPSLGMCMLHVFGLLVAIHQSMNVLVPCLHNCGHISTGSYEVSHESGFM